MGSSSASGERRYYTQCKQEARGENNGIQAQTGLKHLSIEKYRLCRKIQNAELTSGATREAPYIMQLYMIGGIQTSCPVTIGG